MSETSKIVLLADDDADDQDLFREAFSQATPSVEVLAVSFGRDVLAYLRTCADTRLPSLMVLDYNMPDMNGAQVLELLSENERSRLIPAVVWSTSNAFLYKEVCKKNGAKDYFQKPHQFDEMIALCRKIFEMIS